jgi:hypothetical protein
MNCKFYQREIDQAEMEGPLSRDAVKHLESCVACRSFKNEREQLRRLIGDLERVSAPANFDTKLKARLVRSKTEWRAVWFLRPNFLRAACVSLPLLLIVIGVVLTRPFAYFSNGDDALNGVSRLPSIAIDELSPDKIINKEQIAVVIAPPFENVTDGSRQISIRTRKEKSQSTDSAVIGVGRDKITLPLGFEEQAIILPVRPESRSHYVVVNGKKVPLLPVTFGSQGLIGGNEARPMFTSSAQRVW